MPAILVKESSGTGHGANLQRRRPREGKKC
jgi:hypothetical protein